MNTYIYTYMYICTYILIHIYTYMYIFIYVYIHIYIYSYICICIYIYIYIQLYSLLCYKLGRRFMYIYLYTYTYIYIFKYIFPYTCIFTGMSAMAACERSKVLVIATNQGDISVWSISSTLESAKKALPPISAPLVAPTKCAKFKAHSESISCLLYITERRLIVTVLRVFHIYFFCFSWLHRLHHLSMDNHTWEIGERHLCAHTHFRFVVIRILYATHPIRAARTALFVYGQSRARKWAPLATSPTGSSRRKCTTLDEVRILRIQHSFKLTV